MKKLFTILILSSFSFLLSAQNSWQKRAAFIGGQRSHAVAFAIGTRGYLATGEDTNAIEKSDLWEYDPGSNSWTQKASLPGAGRRDAIGFSIGNKGYVGTGIDASITQLGNTLNDFWEYSPITNTWTAKAQFPGSFNQGVYQAACFSTATKGYVCGGKIGPANYSDELWEYSPSSNTWTQKTSFPAGPRLGMGSFGLNGKGYFGCGTDYNWENNDFWEYNPANDMWTQKSSFPGSTRTSPVGFAVGTQGYMGMGDDGGYQSDWYEYDPASDSWMVKSSFGAEGRRFACAFVITGAGYVMTGHGLSGKHRDLWEYQPYIIGVEENQIASVNVYPNPATEIIKFDIDENFIASHEKLSIQLFSTEGKLISTKAINGNAHVEMQNENWSSGIYLYTLTDGTKNYGEGRVVVR